MAQAVQNSMPNYLIRHAHPGIAMPADLPEIATRRLCRFSPAQQRQMRAGFMREYCEIVDADSATTRLDDAERQQKAQGRVPHKLDLNRVQSLIFDLASHLMGEPAQLRSSIMAVFRIPGFAPIMEDPTSFRNYVKAHNRKRLPDCDFFLANEAARFTEECSERPFEYPIQESRILRSQSKDFLLQYYDMPCHPHLLPQKMQRFIAELKRRMENQENPIEIAAFAHMELVESHFFEDANGRLARLVMNIILRDGGLPPIYFYSEKEYMREVQKGVRNHSSFAQYIWWKVYRFQTLTQIARETFENQGARDEFIASAGITTCDRVKLLSR